MIALLIVHGIGEQRRGQTTEKLLVGLKAAGLSRRVAIPMVWRRNTWSSSSERDGVIHLVRVDDRDAAAHAGPSQRGEADLRERAPKLRLMQDFVSGDFVEVFDVRNFKRAHGLNRRRQRDIGLAGSFPPRQFPPCGPQCPKDLRAIEPLPCTVLTETHGGADLVVNITGALDSGLRAAARVTLFMSNCPLGN
jgi:hypothetical protein